MFFQPNVCCRFGGGKRHFGVNGDGTAVCAGRKLLNHDFRDKFTGHPHGYGSTAGDGGLHGFRESNVRNGISRWLGELQCRGYFGEWFFRERELGMLRFGAGGLFFQTRFGYGSGERNRYIRLDGDGKFASGIRG